MLGTALNIVLFVASGIFVLSFLVFFHELGHYSVARFFNVAIERFSVGFGKPIVQWTNKHGTKWSISRVPLGGYVKFKGDAGAASNPDAEELEKIKEEFSGKGDVALENIFHFKPLYQRVLIVLAGPIANFILAILMFAAIALSVGSTRYASVVGTVVENSPAEAAGFMPGDTILRMDGEDVSTWSQLLTYVSLKSDTEITAEIDRDGVMKTLKVTPARTEREDFVGGRARVGQIGISIARDGPVKKVSYNPLTALQYGGQQTLSTISATGTYIGRIFKGKESGDQLGSVVKITAITGKSVIDVANTEASAWARIKAILLTLTAVGASISIALGVANLMPIPALDGGHLLYYGYEAVAGRPLSQKKQEFGFRIGFAVLLTLFVVLTINDIGYVRSLFS